LEVAGILEGNGVAATVVDARFLKPFDAGALKKQAAEMPVVTIEDGHVAGGLGGLVALALENAEHKGVHHFGWSDDIPPHGTVRGIRESRGMSSDAIARTLVSALA
jgi:deoxyxylulose-5-phosphate synthase